MSGTPTPVTPASKGKKRELTSPDFDLDTKKNRLVPDTNNSEATPISEFDLEPELETMDSNTSTSTDSQSHIIIPESEMLKLSDMLKDTFRGEIVGLVNGIVEGVVNGLQDQVKELETSNNKLAEENDLLRARVATLERKVDQGEQYSRRNCLRISGVKEAPLENTDNIVMQLAAAIDADVDLPQIDRSHRLGDPTKARTRPRDIIVKFATYRSRQALFKQRTLLKERGHQGVFVNEDLTKFRSSLLYNARSLVKVKLLKGAWSSDGNILVKTMNDRVHRINELSDLFQFGFLVMGPGQPKRPPRFHRPMGPRPGGHAAGWGYAGAAGTSATEDRDMEHSDNRD